MQDSFELIIIDDGVNGLYEEEMFGLYHVCSLLISDSLYSFAIINYQTIVRLAQTCHKCRRMVHVLHSRVVRIRDIDE